MELWDFAPPPLLPLVDHLVYAVPQLDAATDGLESLLGVRAAPGGRHPGEGTHNALLALGGTGYLEIIAPDPGQPAPERERWFDLDRLSGPRLVGWAVREPDLEKRLISARHGGIALGPIRNGTRTRADGVVQSWRFTDPHAILANGVIPFFIDWGGSPHPASSAPAGITLARLRAEHPAAAAVGRALGQLGLALPVRLADAPALIATLDSPRGPVELR
jgi:hypothetical protein